MTRQEAIDYITANCDCWKGDAETLNKLSDDKLVKLKRETDKILEQQAVVNAVRQGFGAPASLTVNAMPAFIQEKIDAKKKAAAGEEEEELDEKGNPVKKAPPKKEMSTNEWMQAAPPDVREAVQNSLVIVKREQSAIVQKLVANVANAETKKTLAARLMQKPLEELRDMLAMIPAAPTHNAQQTQPDYSGAAGYNDVVGNRDQADKDDILPLPTINWAEEAKARQKA